jgi:hypothetical protein
MIYHQLFPQYLHSIVFGQHFNRPPDDWAQATTVYVEKPIWLTAIECTTLAFLIIAICGSALLRLTTLYQARQDGTIKLEYKSGHGDRPLARKEVLAETLLEKMDHGLGEDGEALDVATFWRSVSCPQHARAKADDLR